MQGQRAQHIAALIGSIAAVVAGAAPAHAALATGSYKIDPTTVDFAKVTVGSTELLRTNVKNTSTRALRFGDGGVPSGPFTVVAGGEGNLLESPCVFRDGTAVTAVSVAPGSSCNMYYRFSPTATGAKSATAKITVSIASHSTTDATANVTLKGTGIKPTLTLSPVSLAFEDVTVGTEARQIVEVTNTSDLYQRYLPKALPASSPFVAAPAQFFQERPCWRVDDAGVRQATIVAPDASCTMVIAYRPDKLGSATATTTVSSYTSPPPDLVGSGPTELPAGPAASNTAGLRLKGNSIKPTFAVDPAPADFDAVTLGRTEYQNVTVTNTSDVYQRFIPKALPASSPFSELVAQLFSSNLCWRQDGAGVRQGTVIPPGGSCNIDLAFTPKAKGAASATSVISSYTSPDPGPCCGPTELPAGTTAANTFSLSLKGKGVAPTFSIDPQTLDFGRLTLGDYQSQSIEVTNTSDVYQRYLPKALPSTSPIAAIDASFLGGSCWRTDNDGVRQAAIVPPGGSCIMAFQYYPQKAGTSSATSAISMYTSPDPNPAEAPTELPAGTTAVASTNITLKGVAAKPTGVVLPATLDFGRIAVTDERTMTVTLRNTSDNTQAFAPPATRPASAVLYARDEPRQVTGRCWWRTPYGDRAVLPIEPGDTCKMRFTYAPKATGAQSGSFRIGMYSFNLNSPIGATATGTPTQTIALALKGTGTAAPTPAPTFTVAPTPLDLGSANVGSSTDAEVTVTNTSGVYLRFFPNAFPSGSRFAAVPGSLSEGACFAQSPTGPRSAKYIAPGASCTMTYRFTPTANGPTNVNHTISAYAGGTPDGDTEETIGSVAAALRTFVLTGTGGVT